MSGIIKNTLEKFPEVEFILHVNPNIHTEEILKEFDTPKENVTCYHGHLDSDKLAELIRSVDINLLAYCPKKYAGMPSMGFTEAMCAGNVVVTPEYTWLSREAVKHGTGNVSFKHFTQESITTALLNAIKNFPKLHAKTKRGSKRFLRSNNIKTYMDKILKAVN